MRYRHHRIIVGIAILAIVLLALWVRIAGFTESSQASIPIAESVTPSSSSSSKSIRSKQLVVSMPSAALSSSKSAITANGKEICGIGVFDSVPENADEIQKQIDEKTQHVWQDWKNALLSSDDIAARAVGLYLSGTNPDGKLGFDKARLDELVQLAVNSRNAAAYGIAYQACNKASKTEFGNVCSPINANDWAKLDPDNAVPWLLIASQQDSSGHSAEAIDALKQATEKARIDSYGEVLSAKANWLKPSDLSPLTLNQLEFTIFGNQAAWNILQLGPIHQFCLNGKSSLSDDAKKQYCSRLGKLLVDRGTSAIELGIGRKLGEQAGWPKTEIDHLKELLTAMQSTFGSMTLTSLDCKSVEKVNSYFLMRAELGERGTAQFMIDHSGRSMEELATQYRNNRTAN